MKTSLIEKKLTKKGWEIQYSARFGKKCGFVVKSKSGFLQNTFDSANQAAIFYGFIK